jgi:putative addiction module CopG family antidote
MASFLPDIESYVQQKIATGQFGSREELAAEAIRIYRDLETKHAQLKSDVQAAIDEADQGLSEPLDMDSIKAEVLSAVAAEARKP